MCVYIYTHTISHNKNIIAFFAIHYLSNRWQCQAMPTTVWLLGCKSNFNLTQTNHNVVSFPFYVYSINEYII